jgi:predicted metal-dependent peptidase
MRPERITKLIAFLRDKEPLMYLFLLNANYKQVEAENFFAGVSFKNGITIFYHDRILEMPIEKLYFILTHEAQHIFKQHLHTFKNKMEDDNERLLINIATDAMINEEIKEFDFSYFKELTLDKVYLPDAVYVLEDYKWFLHDKNISKEDGYSSIRYYHWLKENKVQAEQKGDKVSLSQEDSNYSITYTMYDGESVETEEDGNSGEEGDGQQSEQETKNMIERMVRQAEKMESELPGKDAGSMSKKIRSLKKSEINWKKELRKKINFYVSKNSAKHSKKKSFLTYLMNPKSRNDMIFPHFLRQRNNLETAIILAIDTSGSCFFSKEETENFFREIDAIAKELRQTKTGNVYLMQWDWAVHGDIKLYNQGDWANTPLIGGGGTNPQSIFDFILEKCYNKEKSGIHLKNGDLDLYVENEKSLPLVVVLTDGFFYPFKRTGIYEKCRNVLFFTRTNQSIADDTDYIIYK